MWIAESQLAMLYPSMFDPAYSDADRIYEFNKYHALRQAKLINDIKYGTIRSSRIRVAYDSYWMFSFTLDDQVERKWRVQRNIDYVDFKLIDVTLINTLPNMQRNCYASSKGPDRCIARFDFLIDDDKPALTYDVHTEQLRDDKNQVRMPILVVSYNYVTIATFVIKAYKMRRELQNENG